jgi:hypothetical protein
MGDIIDYTICSTDCEHNNRIYTNISSPNTEYCRMTITSLTTMANFVLLDKSDYIVINDVKYCVQEDFSDVNTASLVEYLNGIIATASSTEPDIAVYYDSCSRIYFASSTQEITIADCSYNLKLMLGLVNVQLPRHSCFQEDGSAVLLCPDVGLYLSTPVLYLACNLGSNSYKNTRSAGSAGFTSMRILMRLTNSFFAKQPINNPNGDYTTTVRSSDLSDVRFTLIDANYHEVKLLSPMYLTIQIETIPDNEDSKFNIPTNAQLELQMNDYAYLHDLTERGQEYNQEQVQQLIYMQKPGLKSDDVQTQAQTS